MSIEVGSKVTGKVTGITNFGAFVSLENKQTGLVHISEVSNTFIKDINEVLTVGDDVTVVVTNIAADGKIGLSIRKAQTPEEQAEAAASVKSHPRTERHSDVRPPRPSRPVSSASKAKGGNDFDAMMSAFLQDSSDRLASLKRNTEGKRDGRGGRRS